MTFGSVPGPLATDYGGQIDFDPKALLIWHFQAQKVTSRVTGDICKQLPQYQAQKLHGPWFYVVFSDTSVNRSVADIQPNFTRLPNNALLAGRNGPHVQQLDAGRKHVMDENNKY